MSDCGWVKTIDMSTGYGILDMFFDVGHYLCFLILCQQNLNNELCSLDPIH
jgi:hypothetical protein